jgi:pyridoxine 4-dehydrogenase
MERTVRLGGIEIARIGLGTNRLSYSQEHVKLIRAAAAAGVGLIDTAYSYAGGGSERTIGEALSGRSARCVVATKGGMGPGNGRPEVLRGQVEESLRRLRAESIDLYYLHRIDPQTPLEESLGALSECQASGSIRHIGLSQVDVDEIEQARWVVSIVAVQNHYSLTERRYDGVVDHCEREGIVFVPYFPLRGEVPAAVGAAARRRGVTPAQLQLAWLLRRSPLMLPIPGSLSLNHVQENVASLDLELGDAEFEALAAG